MANDFIPELIPFFGCRPHVPPPAPKKGEKRQKCDLCASKDGLAPEGSTLVCMACHSVNPAVDQRLAGKRTEATRTRELERREIENQAAELRASRKSSKARSSPVLTPDERKQLLAENPGLADIVRAFLDSIGQPATSGETSKAQAEKVGLPAWKRKREPEPAL